MEMAVTPANFLDEQGKPREAPGYEAPCMDKGVDVKGHENRTCQEEDYTLRGI
jgi:hypothetical protein